MKRYIVGLALLFTTAAWSMDAAPDIDKELNQLNGRAVTAVRVKNFIKLQRVRVALFSHPLNMSSEVENPAIVTGKLLSYAAQLSERECIEYGSEECALAQEFALATEASAAFRMLAYLRRHNVSDAELEGLEKFIIANSSLPEQSNQ